jgi:hypothetical protein
LYTFDQPFIEIDFVGPFPAIKCFTLFSLH